MKRSDTITRSVILPASTDVVWAKSFATPAALCSWFPETIEGEFSIGESFFLIWGEHRCEARLTEYDPGSKLAYQWHPGSACLLSGYPEIELTTVTFHLNLHPQGTEVVVIETGFENISPERRGNSMGENSNGWDSELPKIVQQYGC